MYKQAIYTKTNIKSAVHSRFEITLKCPSNDNLMPEDDIASLNDPR
jgi:hypothetical protein